MGDDQTAFADEIRILPGMTIVLRAAVQAQGDSIDQLLDLLEGDIDAGHADESAFVRHHRCGEAHHAHIAGALVEIRFREIEGA